MGGKRQAAGKDLANLVRLGRVVAFHGSQQVLDLGGSPVRRELVDEHLVRGAVSAPGTQVVTKPGPRAPG